jgi:hypothetical protein
MQFDIMLVVLFLVGNTICITVRVEDIASLVKRSALLCIINLMLLALGERMNPVAITFRAKLIASASIETNLPSLALSTFFDLLNFLRPYYDRL